MIVVDLGAADWGEERSILALADEWHPHVLFAFDPNCQDATWYIGETAVVQRGAAAWVHSYGVDWRSDGTRSGISVDPDGTISGVSLNPASERAASFDLAAFLAALPGPVVLKLDVEGAEYTLLPLLHKRKLDASPLNRILVEWHGEPLDLPWRCPVESWPPHQAWGALPSATPIPEGPGQGAPPDSVTRS